MSLRIQIGSRMNYNYQKVNEQTKHKQLKRKRREMNGAKQSPKLLEYL